MLNDLSGGTENGSDYRYSHLQKGEDYDCSLSCDPFDAFMASQEQKILGAVVPRLFPRGIPRYLDFACGTGRITHFLESHAEESYAVDISEKMQEQARRKCSRTTFFLGDVTRENLGVPPANLVTAFRFFANAQDDLRRAVLAAMSKLMLPHGYLIINHHRNRWTLGNLLQTVRFRKVNEDLSYFHLAQLLRDTGFQIRRTYGVAWWFISHHLNRPWVMNSRVVNLVEPPSRVRPLALICPDIVIVAQRVS